jgi:cytochrome c oxidase cbb3-type subunit 2
MAARSPVEFQGVALLTGLGTGLTTVMLAGMLRRAVGEAGLGLILGTGTGLAYAVCNLPAIFAASGGTQARLALLAVALGLVGGRALQPRVAVELPVGGDYSRRGTVAWVLVFSALVAFDSAAFYVVQHTPTLKENLWDGPGRLVLNAGVHLGAAVLAGWALDRRRLGWTVFAGAAALLTAGGLISGGSPVSVAGLLYITGVSAYSVALVYYPVRGARPGLAALIYAVAGWGGSAVGIALAEGRHDLPPGWLIAAGLVIGLGLWGGAGNRRGAT